jgi:hypothetical protein
MALINETCDFARTAAKARTMTDGELAYAVKDCREAAMAAEALVRDGFASNPGKYWDEMYTYGAEQARRENAARLAEHRAMGGALRR